MLIDFSVKNYGPFRDKTRLSLQRTSADEHPENLIDCPAIGEEALCSAAIFGPNSSGKSYILRAVSVLTDMVRMPRIPNMKITQYQPFRLSSKTVKEPVEMEIRFVTAGVLYHYSLSFDSNKVVSESLYHYPNGRRSKVFDREGSEFTFTKVKKNQKEISEKTAPNTTYISVAAQFNNEICLKAHRGMVEDIIFIAGEAKGLFTRVAQMINDSPDAKRLMIRAMKIADFGISDVISNVEKKDISELEHDIPSQLLDYVKSILAKKVTSVDLALKHDFNDSDADEKDLYFPIGIESNGTMQMLCIMGPIIDSLQNGKTIIIDEFGLYLHSDISRWIISQFKSNQNPKGAQIIVSTHDQMLMDTAELFRRDQIFFTRKNPSDGSSELYSLSDFKGVRKDTDARKGYSIGRYEALPFISPEDLIGWESKEP
jgi:AAA15 family ATPase/GTPase